MLNFQSFLESRTLHFALLLKLLCDCPLVAVAEQANAPDPLVQEIIDQEERWEGLVRTDYSEAVWQIEKGGNSQFVHGTLSRDDLNRHRYLVISGGEWNEKMELGVAAGHSVDEWIHTGKELVRLRDVSLDFTTFTQPTFFPASHSAPVRDPFAISRIGRQIKTVLQSKGVVQVDGIGDKKKLVKWTHPTDGAKWVAEVERCAGAICVKRISSSMPDGKPGGSNTEIASYRIDDSGIPVAERAVIEYRYNESQLESLKKIRELKKDLAVHEGLVIKYQLIDLRINAPDDFPEGTFEVEQP